MPKTFAEQLEWRDNTPDRTVAKRSSSKRIGKKLGLPFNEFLWHLYKANETLKKNDGELYRQIMLEYGQCKDKSLLKLLKRRDRDWVQHYRNEYNRGNAEHGLKNKG
jgi:hypothetical protein